MNVRESTSLRGLFPPEILVHANPPYLSIFQNYLVPLSSGGGHYASTWLLFNRLHRSWYLRSRFNLTTVNPLETAGLGKIFHIFAASIGLLQVLPLIFENSAFSCIIAIFLNKILLEIKAFSNFFKAFNSSGIGCKTILLQTACHVIHF